MFWQERLTSFVDIVMSFVSLFGCVTWLLVIPYALALRFSKGFKFRPTRKAIMVLKILSNKYVFFFMIFSAAVISFSLAKGYYNEYVRISLAFVIAIFIKMVIGPKGFAMPLGHGLSMTIDKAPDVGVALSTSVLSFHVDKQFVRKRKLITELICQSAKDAGENGANYDVVLKSWIFGPYRSTYDARVVFARLCMYKIKFALIFFALMLAASSYIWFSAGVYKDYSMIDLGMWLSVVSGVATVAYIVSLLYSAQYFIGALYAERATNESGIAVKALEHDLVKKASFCSVHAIEPRPVSKIHLLSFSVVARKVIKSFGGDESGVVLKRR